ncbi:MAG: hypothetical protein Q8L10_04935 [Candidatus Moranbacteria bacterium]|nr:hypothetical protein [Candidatus Moranbacteria bacterium]
MNTEMNKINEILKAFSSVKLTIKESGQTVVGQIVKNDIIVGHGLPEAICQIVTAEKLNKYSNEQAILTTQDGIERNCIIHDYSEDIPANSIFLRSVDLNR